MHEKVVGKGKKNLAAEKYRRTSAQVIFCVDPSLKKKKDKISAGLEIENNKRKKKEK